MPDLTRAADLYRASGDLSLYNLAKAVEAEAVRLLEEYHPGRKLQTNVEFYTALLLHGVGLPAELAALNHPRARVVAATEVVAMDERPQDALRRKKDSSMRVAINLVKDGTAQACVSAGNTGALMAISRFVLKTLPGIDRPAIAAICQPA